MRLIQISAWHDSGGGFTHRLFDGHPKLRVWPFELLLGRDGVSVDAFNETWFHGRFRWPRLRSEIENGDIDALFDAVSDLELKSVLGDKASAKHKDFSLDITLADWRAAVCERWTRSIDKTQSGFLEAYCDGLFDCFDSERDDARPLLGHCPVAILDAPETWTDFPTAHFLHVVRSPFGGFADMRRRHPTLDPQVYGQKWALVNGTAATWAGKRPDSVTIITLRQLAENRSATMKRLCELFGLAFDPVLLVPTWRGRRIEEARMGPFGGVPDIGSVNRDHAPAELSLAERDVIQSITNGVTKLLAEFGHEIS